MDKVELVDVAWSRVCLRQVSVHQVRRLQAPGDDERVGSERMSLGDATGGFLNLVIKSP